MKRSPTFAGFANWAAHVTGTSWAFIAACLLVVVWGLCGPFFHYSDTWQLVINTSTTVLTFLIVFLIQNTQNRHSSAIQIKLDELIRALEGAHNVLLDLEDLTEEQLEKIRKSYASIATKARQQPENDTGKPEIDLKAEKE